MSNLAIASHPSQLFAVEEKQVATITEKVIAENGNLLQLTAVERKVYYLGMCQRYGLDPFSNPFDYLTQKSQKNGDKLTLYPNARAANAFAAKHNLSITIVSRSIADGLAIAEVSITNGRRTVPDIGVVAITDWVPRDVALKKALTQARRRAILAFWGFADTDEDDRRTPSETMDPPIDAIAIEGYIVPEYVEPEPSSDDAAARRKQRFEVIRLTTKHTWKQIGAITAKLFDRDIKKQPLDGAEEDKLRHELLIDWAASKGCDRKSAEMILAVSLAAANDDVSICRSFEHEVLTVYIESTPSF